MKRIFHILIFIVSTQLVFSNLLYQITDGEFKVTSLSDEYRPMNDGEHYTMLTDSVTLMRYSYKTGLAVDTVLRLDKVKNGSPISKIAGYEFSPTEEYVLVYADKEYRYRRTFMADYYLYNINRKEMRPLSESGKQEAPLFSPDGRYIAFARDNNLFMHKVDYNTEIAITKDGKKNGIINGVPDWVYEEEFEATRYFEWSPDSKLLAFVKFDETEVRDFSFQQFNSKTENGELNLYPGSFSYKYPKAGEKNSKVTVYIYEDFTKNTRPVKIAHLDEEFYVPRISWTNSVDQLAIFKLNRNQNKLEMYLANPKSTIAKLTLTEEDKYYIDYKLLDYIQFFDDNSGFLFVSERDGYRHVYKYRMNGLLEKQLTSGTWDVTAVYGYDEKTATLYYQSAETSPLQRNVYSLDTKGKKTLLTDGKGTHNAVFNNKFTYFIDNVSYLEQSNQITLRNNKGHSIRTLEDNKELTQKFKELDLPKKEFFIFSTSDNVELNGWIIKPKDFDSSKKYPVLLVQYSGPNSQQVLDMWKIDWEYYLAHEKGYIVACVDGRGTGARGAEFRKSTYRELGVQETKDQIEAAKYLGKQSYIDKDRIGIWGWSYGGFITLLAMSEDSQIFKAGIAVAPVTDWRLYNTLYTERFMRRPQENFKGYDITSPLQKADKLQGNLLIVHGTADDNVHAQNTMLYTERLVEQGKQFEMQIYTDKNHSILGNDTRRHLYTRKVNFLLKNL